MFNKIRNFFIIASVVLGLCFSTTNVRAFSLKNTNLENNYAVNSDGSIGLCSKNSNSTFKEGPLPMVLNVINLIINASKLIVPLILIIASVIQFAKAVIQGDDKAIPSAISNTGKRLIACIIVFMVPSLLQLILQKVTKQSSWQFDDCNCTYTASDGFKC